MPKSIIKSISNALQEKVVVEAKLNTNKKMLELEKAARILLKD